MPQPTLVDGSRAPFKLVVQSKVIAKPKALVKPLVKSKPKITNYLAGKSKAEAKQLVARTGYAARTGDSSWTRYRELESEYVRLYPQDAAPANVAKRLAATDTRTAAAARSSRSGSRVPSTSAAPLPAANAVSVTQIEQEETWWCGPATAFMIIDQLAADGKIKSTNSKAGSSLSQSKLASENYLSSNGGGGTYRTDMQDSLNRWTGTNLFSITGNPTPDQFAASVTENVDKGQATAVATLEPGGEIHYNGHPSGYTTDHWIVAKGYSQNGKVTQFADAGTSIWPNADRYFTANTERFVERYVQPDKAIVW